MPHHQSCELSSVRFLHNVINAPSVNVYLDKKLVAANLSYKDFTGYLNLPADRSKLKIKISQTGQLLVSSTIKLQSEAHQTIIILGSVSDLSTIIANVYLDDLACPVPGNAHLRFIHGVYGAPAVDVYVNDKLTFSNVKYKRTGKPKYAPVRVGTVTVPGQDPNYVNVSVKVAGTNTVVVGPLPVYLISGGVYTMVASGSLDLGLSAVLSQDNPDSCEKLQMDFVAQKYMGKWYQIAWIPQFYGSGCVRQTAEYTLLSNRINVFNTCIGSAGQTTPIIGSAVVENPCEPAALKVTFPNPPPPTPPLPVSPPGPNYLVHKTDYVNYALVGSPSRTSFYILARKSKIHVREYNKLLAYAKKLGYDTSKVVADKGAIDRHH